MSLWVVLVIEHGTIKECIVIQRQETATALYRLLQDIYGGNGAAIFSRELDAVPIVIVEAALGVAES